jgi:hypothetical protein
MIYDDIIVVGSKAVLLTDVDSGGRRRRGRGRRRGSGKWRNE